LGAGARCSVLDRVGEHLALNFHSGSRPLNLPVCQLENILLWGLSLSSITWGLLCGLAPVASLNFIIDPRHQSYNSCHLEIHYIVLGYNHFASSNKTLRWNSLSGQMSRHSPLWKSLLFHHLICVEYAVPAAPA
jgi:hypothetical protein